MFRTCGLLTISAFAALVLMGRPGWAAAPVEEEEDGCIGCHINVTPGIVKEYLDSPMATASESVSCGECHGNDHKTKDDHAKATLPTSETCIECHEEEGAEFRKGKHELAWFAMKSQIAYHSIPSTLAGDGYRGCSGCHKLGRKGLMGVQDGNTGALKHDKGKEEAEYHYGNAQCDACHTRHSFRKQEAQDPRTCSNCHMGFDHPQWEMYTSAKHGIIWQIEGEQTSGGRAPTCQKCHMPEGDHEVSTPWGFLGLRIPTKENVLALIEVAPSLEKQLRSLAGALPSGHYDGVDDDPEWTLDRAAILQAAGILDADLQPTSRFTEIVVQGRAARGPAEFNRLRSAMKRTCNECHSSSYVGKHFDAADLLIKQTDQLFAKAIRTVQGLYADGILKKPEGWEYAPDLLQYYHAKTKVEQELYLIMLEHRQRAFQGAFHASNDYAHWYGWAPLNTSVNEIMEEAERMRREHAAQE
ncbi:MAG: cytochrome C [bacterium]|nr:cytochrome C [bacterium]